jgi:hypothetical protein
MPRVAPATSVSDQGILVAGLTVLAADGALSGLVAERGVVGTAGAWFLVALLCVVLSIAVAGVVAFRRCGGSWRALAISPYSIAATTWLAMFFLRPLQLWFSPGQAAQPLAELGVRPGELTRNGRARGTGLRGLVPRVPASRSGVLGTCSPIQRRTVRRGSHGAGRWSCSLWGPRSGWRSSFGKGGSRRCGTPPSRSGRTSRRASTLSSVSGWFKALRCVRLCWCDRRHPHPSADGRGASVRAGRRSREGVERRRAPDTLDRVLRRTVRARAAHVNRRAWVVEAIEFHTRLARRAGTRAVSSFARALAHSMSGHSRYVP